MEFDSGLLINNGLSKTFVGQQVNKDDNIHKNKDLKCKDKGILTLVECKNLIRKI